MKVHLVALMLICSLTSSYAGKTSARTALKTLTKATSANVAAQVVYVFGPHGQDQPAFWLFITKDGRGVFREHKVAGAKYAGVRTVPGFSVGNVVTNKRWKTDSTSAFIAANNVAKAGKRGFEYANLEMRCSDASNRPVWFITLVSAKEEKVAEISISGENGSVIKKAFFMPEDVPLPKPGKKGAPAPASRPGQTQYIGTNQMAVPPAPPSRSGLLDNVSSGLGNAGSTIGGWLGRLIGR